MVSENVIKNLLEYLDLQDFNFKLVIQGSFVLKKEKVISRNPNDLDLILISDEIDSITKNKNWNILKSKLKIISTYVDNPIFKKVLIEFDNKKIFLEIHLMKKLDEKFYYKLLNKNIYAVTIEFAKIAKIFQIYDLKDTKNWKFVNKEKKIKQTIEDLGNIFISENEVDKLIKNENNITYLTILSNSSILFFLRNWNYCTFFSEDFTLIKSIDKVFADRRLIKWMTKFFYSLDFQKIKIINKIVDIFIRNKIVFLDILFEKNNFKNFELKEQKQNFVSKNKSNFFYGNVIFLNNFELIVDAIKFFLFKIFINETKVNFIDEIQILFRDSKLWNHENILISKKFKYKNILEKWNIKYIYSNDIDENQIFLPIQNQKILLENIIILYVFLNGLILEKQLD
ncbi:hypothetical protein [Mycoplasmopsis pulmonis]|nr:hypothetical protein [Mycoplasmopsis pulmonis]VEU67849.1 Uncharacterised protein [Mycoplasmopsis pulmonis]